MAHSRNDNSKYINLNIDERRCRVAFTPKQSTPYSTEEPRPSLKWNHFEWVERVPLRQTLEIANADLR